MDKAAITPALVKCLLHSQFPGWADLLVSSVELDGWDNTTFRLGEGMSVRLPSADPYVAQVEKEHRWLPVLAEHLPLAIPQPLARGIPGCGYPRPWSIYRWLEGRHATTDRVTDLTAFAHALAEFLAALYAIDPSDGPIAGPHSFNRGGPLSFFDGETRATIDELADDIDAEAVTGIWDAAVSIDVPGPPVWVHGDVAPSNLLVDDGGRLAGVVDFGCAAVGDPACDTVIAWTFFSGASRDAFMARLPVDDGTWVRGRGWALWKALITHADAVRRTPDDTDRTGLQFGWSGSARSIIDELVADHRRGPSAVRAEPRATGSDALG